VTCDAARLLWVCARLAGAADVGAAHVSRSGAADVGNAHVSVCQVLLTSALLMWGYVLWYDKQLAGTPMSTWPGWCVPHTSVCLVLLTSALLM
jgi:hypothetical protein